MNFIAALNWTYCPHFNRNDQTFVLCFSVTIQMMRKKHTSCSPLTKRARSLFYFDSFSIYCYYSSFNLFLSFSLCDDTYCCLGLFESNVLNALSLIFYKIAELLLLSIDDLWLNSPLWSEVQLLFNGSFLSLFAELSTFLWKLEGGCLSLETLVSLWWFDWFYLGEFIC